MGYRLGLRKWLTITLLVGALAGLMAGPLSLGGNQAQAQAGGPEFGFDYGQTLYAQTGSDLTILLNATDSGGDIVTIDAPMRPSGTTFVSNPGDPGQGSFEWTNAGPAGGYSLKFTATDVDGSSDLSILLVIEDSAPVPTISLDREEYLLGDEVFVIVRDDHADVNFAELDEVEVRVTSDSDQVGLEINLTEDMETPRTFVGSVLISDSIVTGALTVNVGDTVNVEYTSADGTDVTATAEVTDTAVRMARTIYSVEESPIITVSDPSANTSNNSDTVTVTVASSLDDLMLNLMETGVNTGIFEGNFNFSETMAGSDTLLVALEDDVKVSYGSRSLTVEKYYPLTVTLDKGEYLHTDLAEITVIDVKQNLDNKVIETISVLVETDSDSQDFLVPLRETGNNTGVFVNIAYVGFDANDVSRPDDNVIGVDVSGGGNTIITASYGTELDTATVKEGISGTTDPGTGTSGAPATEGIPVGSSLVINCSSFGGDTDYDGICNLWELGGSNLLRVYYPQTSGQYYSIANTCGPCPTNTFKDVFVEIDYARGFKPYYDSAALKYVALENAKAEVSGKFTLHYIVDDNIGIREFLPVWSQEDTTPNNGIDTRGYDQIKRDFFGSLSERNQYSGGINSNFMSAKKQVFHYAVFADKMQHDPQASGLAEILGNDIIVSLGSFTDAVGSPGLGPLTIAMEEGTFLHELGHNLGLDHGGGFTTHPATGFPTWMVSHEVNCKPNYPSVMNYVRQIPPFGVNLGDTTHYSKAAMSDLDIDLLNEQTGMKSNLNGWNPTIAYGITDATGTRIMTAPIDNDSQTPDSIDWNGGGISTTMVNSDIINLNIPGCSEENADFAHLNGGVLKGFNDMNGSSLLGFILDFRVHNPSVFVSGMHETEDERPQELDLKTWNDINALGTSDSFTLLGWHEGAQYEIRGESSTVKAARGSFIIGNGALENITLSGQGMVELQLQVPLKDAWDNHPTMVSINDGAEVTQTTRTDPAGIVTIPLALSGDGPHSIKIMNAAIAPEFPVAAILLAAVMASMVGLMVLRGRMGSGKP
ncbi:hypothetical protein [Candidatus Nitrososphaera sp. FF02]|uniref:hypothetical protein n=1 Tax=Candidatus Nitrososphaera sp. FF02 TaxID=3398226 RepID=UPI0039E9E217